MASLYQAQVSSHLVSLYKFDISIQRVLDKTLSLLAPWRSLSMLPPYIGIDIDYNGHEESVPVLTKFVKKLRQVHQTAFVRFVSDAFWTQQSQNGDIFYIYDLPKSDWCDVIWTFRLVNDEQIEVHITQPVDIYRQTFLSDLSDHLKRFIATPKDCMSPDDISVIMTDFYKNTKRVNRIKHLRENLHILLIPTKAGLGFYPVALYGMSHFDAKRRGAIIEKQQKFDRHRYSNFLNQELTPGDNIYNLLHLIQETERFGAQHKSAKDTYALVEALFSVYSTRSEGERSRHDMVLFNVANKRSCLVDTYHYTMKELDKVA